MQFTSSRRRCVAHQAVGHCRSFISALALLGSCLLVGQAAALDRPNIVLIVADDLGWSDLACYGADLHETPHLDRLALAGVRFSEGYAAAPVCTPTRAALMTGKHPARLHMTIWREAAAEPPRDRALLPPVVERDLSYADRTLAEILHDAGYATLHVGKWHLGGPEHFPEAHGFDINIGGNIWGAPATHFFPYRVPGNRERRYVPGLVGGKPGEYLADRLTEEALRLMDAAEGRPFFLNLWHYSVHTPTEAPQAEVEHFRGKLRPELRHQNATYAAMVKNLDANVGRLLRYLDEKNLAANTIVIFTSDNGGYTVPSRQLPNLPVTNNAPLKSGKGSLYEGGIRVPLIVRWPGHTAAGRVCDQAVTSTDLYRTIAEVAGTPPDLNDAQLQDGLSIAQILKNESARLGERDLFWHYPHYYPTTTPCTAIRQGSWKLIDYHETDSRELYNLREDPGEEHDLASANPEKTATLYARLKRWREDVGAQMPTKNPLVQNDQQ
jgi:arylsulfatase A